MSGGSGVPEVDETPKNVSSPECDRCGAAAVVTRGDLVFCGPCYYAETVRERRRTSVRNAPPASTQIMGAIEEIERAVMTFLSRRCSCSEKEAGR